MGQIVGAWATVHAPQLFTRPPTEVPEQIDADIAAMKLMGKELDELKPDAVIGDLDGVVVVPREDVAEVVKAAQARIVKEEKNRERLRAGEAGLDMYGLRAKLKDLGVVYVDQED